MTETGPTPASFTEYQTAFPQEARTVIAYSSYRTLANLDHDRFWDPEIYTQLKAELQTDDPLSHPGVRLYDKKRLSESPPRRAASDTELAGPLTERLRQNTKDLQLWQVTEPEEYAMAQELIEVIKNGQLEQFDAQRLKETLLSSLYIFPGLALALLIRKDQLSLQEIEEKI